MKKILFIFLVICNSLYANNTHKNQMNLLFEEGGKAYQKKEYAKALFEYDKIVHQGYKSSKIFYNMGNCYFRLGSYELAIYHYEKSLKLKPNDPQTIQNLNITNQRIVDKFENKPKFILLQWWQTFYSLYSLNVWACIILGLIAGFSACLFLYLISYSFKLKKFYFYSCAFILFLCLFTFSAAWTNRQNKLKEFAIIMDTKVSIKSSPDYSSQDVSFVHQGSKIEILDQVNGFSKIKLADKNSGWVPKNCYKII